MSSLIPFAVYATASRKVRDRLGPALWLSAVPVAPAQQGAVTAVVTTSQAKDSVRREQRVAEATATATAATLTQQGTTLAAEFARHPVLKDIDVDALTTSVPGLEPRRAAAPPAADHAVPAPRAALDDELGKAVEIVTAALKDAEDNGLSEEEEKSVKEKLAPFRGVTDELVHLVVE